MNLIIPKDFQRLEVHDTSLKLPKQNLTFSLPWFPSSHLLITSSSESGAEAREDFAYLRQRDYSQKGKLTQVQHYRMNTEPGFGVIHGIMQ